jgi:biotin carboxylase
MKKLAVIGASYLQLPLVMKAKEMGLETHCFAWEEGAVCKDVADFFYPISIIEKEKILEICKLIGVDGIATIASDAGVPTICYVAQKLGLIANNYDDSQFSTNKFLMRQRFVENGVESPRFTIADKDFSVDGFKFPLIVKPTDRSGSRGVQKVENIEDLSEAVIRAQSQSFSNQAIIEEYITGSEVSVETISWQGKHYILAMTDKVTTGGPYFVELEHHQPSSLKKEIQERVILETKKALNALNLCYGASHAEFIITSQDEVFVIEVGARMGGDFIGSDLVKLSTGYDFLKGVINIALGCFTEPIITENNYSGVCFLSKETEYLLPVIENARNVNEIVKSEIMDNTLHSIQCSADRSGYFIYQSKKRFIL